MSNPKLKRPSDKYLFNIDDYEVVQLINKGGFGIVNLVRNKKTHERYAAKTNLIQSTSQNKLFISREVRILIQIQHPTIIQFRGFSYIDFHGAKNITILMDYMKEGSLAKLIDQESKSLCPIQYDNTKRQIILVGIARGMMLLHKRNIIHRDLKPENILLDENYHPVITDFGLSKFFDPQHSTNQSIADSGTWQYMAPEVITGNHFNTKADVYAFGILMYEVVSGKRAYKDLLRGKKKPSIFEMKTKIKDGFRPSFDFPIKNGLKKMIEKCWSNNPTERPTFQEVFKKLSLSTEDYFLEFEGNVPEPVITDDDDDDDDDEIDENEADFIMTKKYCLEDVDVNELLDYVDEIQQEAVSVDKREQLESRKSDDGENEELRKQIKQMEEKISFLEKQLSTIQESFLNSISIEPDLQSLGILGTLMKNQKNKFDKPFISSISSNDTYGLLRPDIKLSFITSNRPDFFIEFELKDQININGVKIYTNLNYFPKTFDILVDDKIVKSIKEASELNGVNKCMTVTFNPTPGKKVKIINKGPNWDEGNYFASYKAVELLSTESKYSKGVFNTLIANSENKDHYRVPVIINAYNFDNNSFYLLNPQNSVCSQNIKNSWFQVEFTRGMAVITAFRLKRVTNILLNNYKIICTDDSNKPIESWNTMIEINEKKKDEHKLLDIYNFSQPSPPIKVVRIVMTGPTWDNDYYLSFYHFDLFGKYFPNLSVFMCNEK